MTEYKIEYTNGIQLPPTTLRDEFAGKVLEGIFANSGEKLINELNSLSRGGTIKNRLSQLASITYAVADAMIAAREATNA